VLADIFGVDGIIVIVVVAIVLLFGGSQLPKLARGLGSASHEFKKGVSEGEGTSSLPAGDEKKDASA
jgi:sec-independent protein translocase protein TatA